MKGLTAIPLSLALLGVAEPEGLRAQIEWAAKLHADRPGAPDEASDEAGRFRALQLNAAAPECRPRLLGRSARRDLAALLRRSELSCSGVDLFIPPDHLTDPAHSDRALSALLDAIDFAAEMAELTRGGPVLSTLLPDAEDAAAPVNSALSALRERASSQGVRIADCRWPLAKRHEPADSPIGVGVDVAQVLLDGSILGDPAREVSRLGPRVVSIRVSDASASGRAEVGSRGGRLDVLALSVAAATGGYRGSAVVDVRGLRDAARGATAALAAWRVM